MLIWAALLALSSLIRASTHCMTYSVVACSNLWKRFISLERGIVQRADVRLRQLSSVAIPSAQRIPFANRRLKDGFRKSSGCPSEV